MKLRGSRIPRRTAATYTHPHYASQISILRSNIDTSSTEYKENLAQMQAEIDKIDELKKKFSLGGSQKARDKHVARGKMLVRE